MRILLFAILLCPLAAIQAEEVSDHASNSRRSLRERNGPQRAVFRRVTVQEFATFVA